MSLQVFERPGKVIGVLEDGKIEWMPEKVFIPWTSDLEDLEFLPHRVPKGRAKTGKSSQADLKELRLRIPELTEKLKPKESLHSGHLALGDWLVLRDLRSSLGPELPKVPSLFFPTITVLLSSEDPAQKLEAQQAIMGHWKRHPRLGVPIGDGGHWTLLVLERTGAGKFEFFNEEFLKVRYYDSLSTFHNGCWKLAKVVIEFLAPKVDAMKFKINRCRTFQSDAISCGLYVLHYWEGEVRQFVGQGWVVGRPNDKAIEARRSKLSAVSQEIEEYIKEGPKLKKKGSKAVLEVEDVCISEGPLAPSGPQFFEFLASEAKSSLGKALVEFYGCPKCRYARGGCINYFCNPTKFEEHKKKFPEKYDGRRINPSAWKSVSKSEIAGEP